MYYNVLVLHEGNTTPTSQRRRTKKSVSPNRRNTYSAADLPSLVPKGELTHLQRGDRGEDGASFCHTGGRLTKKEKERVRLWVKNKADGRREASHQVRRPSVAPWAPPRGGERVPPVPAGWDPSGVARWSQSDSVVIDHGPLGARGAMGCGRIRAGWRRAAEATGRASRQPPSRTAEA